MKKNKEPKSKPKGAAAAETSHQQHVKKRQSKLNQKPADPTPEQGGGDAETILQEERKKKEEEEKEAVAKLPVKEWDSEAVRSANLFNDGFNCCTVMIMEDSPEISKYTEYLHRAIETGIRKKFASVSGSSIAERVRKFLVATGQRDPKAEDTSYMDRQDIFAEAIKFSMMSIKETIHTEMDADKVAKEMELSGARSKEFVRLAPPVTLNTSLDENVEVPPPPPPTVVTPGGAVQEKKAKRKSDGSEGGVGRGSKASEGKNSFSQPPAPPAPSIGVKTRMRKRGEIPMPELEVIDDTPPKGPQCFVLLQGFYNPKVIEELRNIGIKVEGILLMTDEKVNRYNFSIMDVEDSIPGTFRPKIVLPKYLKAFEKISRDPETMTMNSPVTQFWVALTEMYNSAPPDSYFHDLALMNIKIPDMNRPGLNVLESPEGMTFLISKVFDEVSRRIYEMLVFEEWHQEFTSAADVNQLQPLEPTLPRDIYDKIIGHIPSECISVPIILEALIQQVATTLDKESGQDVPLPCYDTEVTQGVVMGKSNFGHTNWGVVAKPEQSETKNESEKHTHDETQPQSSLFMVPMYIKAGDYASIRSCHLNESLAAKIASCQLSGDMRNIQGFLWHNVPDFNRGLHMKLLANLNHFMYFMPPDLIHYEDMFYVLHLLLSAGVELHLLKESERRREAKEAAELEALAAAAEESSEQAMETLSQSHPEGDNKKFPGTNLSTEHNYFAMNLKTGLNFVISPDSNNTMTVASLGQSQVQSEKEEKKIDVDQFLKETLGDAITATTDESMPHIPDVKDHREKKLKRKKSKLHKHNQPEQPSQNTLDPVKVGRMTVVGAIETAAEHVQSMQEYNDKEKEKDSLEKKRSKKKGKKDKDKGKSEIHAADPGTYQVSNFPVPIVEDRKQSVWGMAKKSLISPDGIPPDLGRTSVRLSGAGAADGDMPTEQTESAAAAAVEHLEAPQKTGFETMNPSKEKKRFIACEEEFFEDINDASVIQTLLECPALLAISDSGALDLSHWVEKYLFSCGVEIGEGLSEGVLLGELKNWNFVEELQPIQTVQMLNAASQEYLSMQRMYCPFYDTLLFIFNNPMPPKMTAESNFYFKLKTLPGLQHFLEYTIDDPNVLRWVEQLDAAKRLEMGEAYSIQTLLDIIPEEQWLLVPSIKYQIMIDNATQSPFKNLYHSANSGSNIGSVATAGKDADITSVKSANRSEGKSAQEDTSATQLTEQAATGGGSKRGSGKSSSKSKKRSGDQQSEKLSVKTTAAASGGAEETEEKAVSEGGERSRKSGESQQPPSVHSPPHSANPSESARHLLSTNLNFTCYDLGKRVAVVGNDTFFLFPMDGTVIRYDISTIEPEFRMMQLSVTKNGNQTFFYPYYIPRDFDLSTEDYVVCPYFHMILRNGTIFAFQDIRAEEAAPYKVNTKDGKDLANTFGFEKVLFRKEVERKLHEVEKELSQKGEDDDQRMNSADSRHSGEADAGSGKKQTSSKKSGKKDKDKGDGTPPASPPKDAPLETKKTKKGLKEKKSKKALQTEEQDNSEKETKKEKEGGKKDKEKKKRGKSKANKELEAELEAQANPSPPPTAGTDTAMDGDDEASLLFKGETEIGIGEAMTPEIRGSQVFPDLPPLVDEGPGEWMYPSSENSEDEAEDQTKRRLFFAPPWDDAAAIIQAMTHVFKVTLPSGLLIQVDDLAGPPVLRVVKQSYLGHGSARSQIESSRYYTMDGSCLKFLFNGNIQILTARGVTTNIDELAANATRDTDNETNAFTTASLVKIFNGEVILPNGQHWDVVNGKKIPKNPIYVFTSGPLAGGEVFRRRQDGMICLHRFDGTVITHYPDGTRFTTRMVICENYDEEDFPDWTFVGLKYMIEHPNYSTVLFNTLSGNTHLKLPYGEWVRVFADGNIRISTEDEYKLDVDKNRAVLTYPSCIKGPHPLPNITAVRLWHTAIPASEKPPQETQERASQEIQKDEDKKEETPAAPEPPPKEEPLAPEPEKPKKEPKTRRTVQQAKSLHPKIKQRDKDKKGRSTRMSAVDNNVRKSKSPSPTPDPNAGGEAAVARKSETQNAEVAPAAATDSAIETQNMENKDSNPEVPTNKAPENEAAPTSTEDLKAPEPIKRKTSFDDDAEGDSLLEFLRFTDDSTFCKAVDSWDNRFVMNLYGASLVDKMERKEESKVATERLLQALSEHSNLPKKYLSGILQNTSSINLDNVAKRFQALKINSDKCENSLPKTKIFVVKRDLTGFQYLQKPQVDDVVTKAYASKESMVVVDPLPQRKPRKFITVMRPVEEVEDPHGMWTRPYIEPMFRPRNVTNKHLIVANPNDLRWFGYILNAAHVKRPKFMPEPRESFKEKKRREEEKKLLQLQQEQEQQELLLLQQKQLEEEEAEEQANEEEINGNGRKSMKVLAEPADEMDNSGETDRSEEMEMGSEEEGESFEEEESLEHRPSLDATKSPDRVASLDDDKKKKKGKKDKKGEKAEREKEKAEKEKAEKEKEKAEEAEEEKPEKDKKKKRDKKNKISKGSPATTSDEEEDEDESRSASGGEGGVGETEVSLEETTSSKRTLQSSKRKSNRFFSMEPEVEEYPDLDDILGIYEGEAKRRAQAPHIKITQHNLPCNRKRAIVVRSFVEIPKVDENIQRALLAASMSYSETCKAETALYKTYKTEDPRSPEEKKAQTEYKQQLIEHNIDEMHLLEQRPGPVLRFNF